jgi:hypothetical protein
MSDKGKGGSPSSVGEMTPEAFMELMEPMRQSIESLNKSLNKKTESLSKKTESLSKNIEILSKNIEILNKRTGILVEEKARNMATQMFGSDFSKRFLIKSLHEVVKLISKADDSALPKEHSSIQRNDAVEKLAAFLEPFTIIFVQSAVVSVEKAAEDPIFGHADFDAAKETLEAAKESLSNEEQPNLSAICGKLLGAVSKLGANVIIGEESQEHKDKRVKSMTGRFKRKLERIKRASHKNGLIDCSGPGIMFCCALSKAPKEDWGNEQNQLQYWIRSENFDIFDYNEEVECDIRGSVALVGSHATISCGEIKSTFHREAYASAVAQLQLRSNLVEFVLRQIFGKRFTTNTIKKGHLFVLEANEDHQNFSHEVEGDLWVFVHHVH